MAVWAVMQGHAPAAVSVRTRQALSRIVAAFAPPNSPAPVATANVQLSITVEPLTAQLHLDGREVSNPLVGSYAAEDRLHVLTATAPGYEERTYRIRLVRDAIVLVALSPSNQPVSVSKSADVADD
jgi:hypothetical protein